MKKILNLFGLAAFLFVTTPVLSQNYWVQKNSNTIANKKVSEELLPKAYQVFELELEAFSTALQNAPLRGSGTTESDVILAFPMANGKFQNFKVVEAPVLDKELSNLYPEIKSYAGQGVENPSEIVRFSISPLGMKSMLFSTKNGYEFIEPYSTDLVHYMVYKRKDRNEGESDFECTVKHAAQKKVEQDPQLKNADDGILRNYRLVVSTNGEYAGHFGGTVAQALAAINTTMTRVNGIFENDFNVTMTLISATTNVIYTNSSTDPYGSNSGSWNGQLQSTLTSNIGEANYDIGHLFAKGGNNGNAGCIGCVCVNNQKGSAFTSRTIPEGDPFDVDYVAHEIGHQFGGNHTWTFGGNEGTNVQMEPGSGSTIMGYAGITGATDIQANSDPYFHAISIEQITDYVKTTSCQTDINTNNSTPTADAGANYTIPRGTPFVLTGNGTDQDGDQLTYCWEQIDENNASTTYPSTTATAGVAFRSLSPTLSNQRTFPTLATVLAGNTSTTWEAVPNVGRNLNFRLTVRDNNVGGASNESDDMTVTVNAATGPFVVTSPNTNVSWESGSSQEVTWNVAGTTGSPINTNNVNILLSTDGGNTFATTLLANTANDGSATVVIPNTTGTSNRIKVEASNNIFFDISNSNFTITNEPTGPTYCASNGNSVADEYIGNVTIASINNTTGGSSGGYADYTSLSTDLSQDASVTISITPVWTGTVYNEAYAVWIDYNQNGSFNDAGELVYSQSPTTNTPVVGSFTVPTSSTTGATRMRVSMKYNGIPTSCESFAYGEVEDYTVNIVESSCSVGAPCDDQNSCTSGDVYDNDCNCVGTFQDSDNDGVCDADDQCSNSAPGTNVNSVGCVLGCTDATAHNYNSNAQVDDGSCQTCTDGVQNGDETDVDCGGSCDPCATCTDVAISFTFDNYPEETSWTITDANGSTVASGGTYGNQADGSTLNLTECLADGCYDFTINDTYGDGICCAYGNGSYAVSVGGTTVASGGSFASSETTNFCIGATSPTCDDGIQNGDETGIDCGGSSCAPCCTDVAIGFTFDNYPEETSWTITDANGSTVASGGTYGNQADGSTLSLTECLDDGCYDFTINDTYGDGICCAYGNGSYTVSVDGTTVASGGSFNSSETTNFCIGGNASRNTQSEEQVNDLELSTIQSLKLAPNPAINYLLVEFSLNESGLTNLYVMDVAGQVVLTKEFNAIEGYQSQELNLGQLQNGVYFVTLFSKEERMTERLIIAK